MKRNKFEVAGHVGIEPEVRNLENGAKVATFTLAEDTFSYKNKDGKKVEVNQWHTIEAWGKTAELIEKHVKKGVNVFIDGRIKYNLWEKDGDKRITTVVVADRIEFLNSKKKD